MAPTSSCRVPLATTLSAPFAEGKRSQTSKLPPAQKVGEKLANWVREIGVDDMNVSPNHGWRHRFNYEARRARIHPEVRDSIEGHVPGTEGALYGGHVPIELKLEAILKFPRYDVEPATGPLADTERRRKNSRQRMEMAKRAKLRTRILRRKPLLAKVEDERA